MDYKEELRQLILNTSDFDSIWHHLYKLKSSGLSRDEAKDFIEILRIDVAFQEEAKQDQLLEILDVIVGWVHPESRIW